MPNDITNNRASYYPILRDVRSTRHNNPYNDTFGSLAHALGVYAQVMISNEEDIGHDEITFYVNEVDLYVGHLVIVVDTELDYIPELISDAGDMIEPDCFKFMDSGTDIDTKYEGSEDAGVKYVFHYIGV